MRVFEPEAYHQVRHGLYEPTLTFAGEDWGREVLEPWLAAHQPILTALHRIGTPEMACVLVEDEDQWALYAVSRVAETLALPHQPPATNPDRPQDWLPHDAYQQFITAIGGTVPHGRRFHPFLHEIVAVEPADDPNEPTSPSSTWWPGCLIGSLLLLRSGVTVRAGAEHLDPTVATTSTLYWAFRRRYRPASDLSHGWGSNSQWRTDFRLPDRLAYNVDAALDPKAEHPDGASFNRDLDLLRHRCSTLDDEEDEQWPWHNHHAEMTELAKPD